MNWVQYKLHTVTIHKTKNADNCICKIVVGVAWSKNIGPLRLFPEEAPPPIKKRPTVEMQTQNKIGTCIEGGWFTIDPYVVA